MIDINTAIGHWPFRKIPHQSAEALRTHLSRYGITRAAVAHTYGLFYKNCHDANLELAEAIAPQRDFFVGIATLNPAYAAWERDLAACVDALGLGGLRLVPQYHNYSLADESAIEMVKAAASRGIPVFIPHRIVNVRQCHWMDTQAVIALSEVIALARAVPEAHIVFTEYPADTTMLVDEDGRPVCPNLYLETSRMASAYGQVLSKVVHTLGARRVLFGTGAPFKEVSPALLKIKCAELTDAERMMVQQDSALALFGVRGLDGSCGSTFEGKYRSNQP